MSKEGIEGRFETAELALSARGESIRSLCRNGRAAVRYC